MQSDDQIGVFTSGQEYADSASKSHGPVAIECKLDVHGLDWEGIDWLSQSNCSRNGVDHSLQDVPTITFEGFGIPERSHRDVPVRSEDSQVGICCGRTDH